MEDFFINHPNNIIESNITNQILKDSNSIFFHKSLKEYKKSKLHQLSSLAKFLNVSNIYVQDESSRFGLKAFKGLGASYALHRILKKNPNVSIFCTASDGNHGRALAWSAKIYQKKCVVFVPSDVSDSRIKAIVDEGAIVEKLNLNYEDTCKYAFEISLKNNWKLVQDTSWENYETIPAYIMSGYLTHLIELEDTINKSNEPRFDIVFLQCGVGSWAASCIWYYLNRYGKNRPKIILVEPDESSGVFDSFVIGKRVSPIGNLNTIMTGLNCGIPSKSGWNIIKNGCDGVIKIRDSEAKSAVRLYYNPLGGDNQIISGESGAAGLACLTKCLEDNRANDLKKHIQLNKSSRILLFNTEGNTDINRFFEIIS